MSVTIFKEIILLSIIVVLLLIIQTNRNRMNKQQKVIEKLKSEINRLEENTNIKNEMFVRVSHDLRTPLGNMIMLLELLKSNINNKDKINKYIKRLENSSQYLLGLSNNIVDMRRIELGDIQLINEKINIKEVVSDCCAMLEEKIKTKNINFIKKFNKVRHLHLVGDKLRLKQIFMNILVNAINHTPDGGKIIFSAQEFKNNAYDKENNKICIEFKISDNGEGMSTEFLEHIWEAYSKDNTSCFKNIGTGLGMAITKQYVNLMGGEIYVKSEIGVGSVFTIKLAFEEVENGNLKKKKIEKIA